MNSPGTPIQGETRPGNVCLGRIVGANMNSTGDQQIPIAAGRYVVRFITAQNPSISLTTAVGGIYTATAKGGSALVANTQVYSALTGATKIVNLTLAAVASTDARTESLLYLSLTTPQGAAATADIFVFGDILN